MQGTAEQRDDSLLEDLAIGPWVLFAVHLDGLVPAPHVVQKLAVFFLGVVELGKLVALVVWCNVEGGKCLVTSNHECTADDAVVRRAKDGRSAEDVFAGGFEASEESTWKVISSEWRRS